MDKNELEELLELSTDKLKIIRDELSKYDDMAYILLETEAVNKIKRYGENYYKNNFLKNPSGIISDYMKTFLYLDRTEKQLKLIQDEFLSAIRMIELQIKNYG